ncbi:hypothetical protein ACJ41O_003183 [Fusarium nematophilum]
MAEAVGVAAAAVAFAEIAVRAVNLIRSLDTESASVETRINQLETFTEVAKRIEKQSAEQKEGDEQLELTKRILDHCSETVRKVLTELERVKSSEDDTVFGRVSKALLAKINEDVVAELFDELHRDQMCLLIHQSPFPLPGVADLFQDRLRYSSPPENDEANFLNAMFVTDPRDDRSAMITAKGRRVEGTCTWITETLAYRSWLSTSVDPRGLLIQGGPGKGKSMIAIFLTEQLEALAQPSTTETVIYFFCDNRDLKRNSAAAVLRGLIWQLCRLRPNLMQHGVAEVKSRGGDARSLLGSNSIETLWRLFVSMVKDPLAGTITCVLDGLDECDDASINVLSDKLSDFLSASERAQHKCQVIICSRPPRSHHWNSLRDLPAIRLDPDSDEEIGRDIGTFIDKRVNELAREKNWPVELQVQVKDALGKKADGTFLWVGFVAQDLRKKSAGQVMDCLESLPDDLNAIYARILRSVPKKHYERVRLLLSWVCLAFRPLTLGELNALTGQDSLEACVEFCGPILTSSRAAWRPVSGPTGERASSVVR